MFSGAAYSDYQAGAPAAPAPVHDPRRPSALAMRRQQEPSTLQPTGPAPLSRNMVAQQPTGTVFNEDLDDRFSFGPETPREGRREKAARQLQESPLTSAKLEAAMHEYAPILVQGYLELNKEKDTLIEDLGEQLLKVEAKYEDLRKDLWKPSKPSKQLQPHERGLGLGVNVQGGKGQAWDEDYDISPKAAERASARRKAGRGMSIPSTDSSDDSSVDTFASLAQATDFSVAPRKEASQPAASEELRQRPTPTTANNGVKSVSGKLGITANEQLLELEVKLRLMPAIVLLSQPLSLEAKAPASASSVSDLRAVRSALKSVRSALSLVRGETGGKTPASRAFMGLCHFYMGICKLRKGGITRAEDWFAAASVDAAGVYPEAEWAEQWLEAFLGAANSVSASPLKEVPMNIFTGLWQRSRANTFGSAPNSARSLRARTASSGSARSPTADEEPLSAGSWVSGVWQSVRQMVTDGGTQSYRPLEYLREENERSPTYADQASGGRPSPRLVAAFVRGDLDENERAWSPVGGAGASADGSVMYDIMDRIGVGSPPSLHYSDRDGANAAPLPSSPPKRRYRITNPDPSSNGSKQSAAVAAPASPPKRRYRIANPDPSSNGSSSADVVVVAPPPPSRTASYEPAVSPYSHPSPNPPLNGSTPPTSPTHSKSRSLTFSLPFGGSPTPSPPTSSSPQVSPTLSIDSATGLVKRVARRVSTIATGRDAKRLDLVEMAEEGHSPYRSTFRPIGEGGEVAAPRERTRSAEDMV
ncbi:hypothetical protein LTR82_009003 [Friedmanniomyces endolithicus]|uniref:Uncharacterized protein n=1 Tax=Friedmanniomyces endolithicus TaxID=329885 RepID=A0AAN6FPU5_9PEZI|nr:hypothetical protein LTR82_009003 [Friedmanniomyces endolithicus]